MEAGAESPSLADRVRRIAIEGELHERLPEDSGDGAADELARSVNMLLDRMEHERGRVRRESGVGRRILEASSMGIVLVDPAGTTTYVNPTARAMLQPRTEPVGLKPIEAVHLAELQEVVSTALAGPEPRPVECRTGRLDLVITATPLPDGGAMATLRDVTADREAQRSRTDFVANVSHELRTPVTAIMGYSEYLLQEAERLPSDLQPMVGKIDRNARRLRDLFEDLLQLHRVEARRREIPLREESLRPILEEAVIGAADTAGQRGQVFTLRCPPDLVARCNAESLRTMVANLSSNAVNYTHDGGHITVEASEGPGVVTVSIIDDGIGIHPMHHQRIFERFYRVDDARSRRLGGTGLGLALVKHLALASRCRVSVESAEGRGSRFRIHLPQTG